MSINRYRSTPIAASQEDNLEAVVDYFMKGRKANATELADSLGIGRNIAKLLLEEARIILAEDYNVFLHIGYKEPYQAYITTDPAEVASSLRPYASDTATNTTHLPIMTKVGLPILGVSSRTKEFKTIMSILGTSQSQNELGVDALKVVIMRSI